MAAPNQTVIGSAQDGLGRTVVLTEERWAHILDGHGAQMDGLDLAVLRVVEDPEVKIKGNFEGAEVLYARGLGPAKWLAVVVFYSGLQGQVITAYPQTKEPRNDS